MKNTLEKEFENFGYPSDKPCVVCQCTNTMLEPRFGYTVCIDHFKIPPTELKSTIITAVRPSYPPANLICGNVSSGIHPVHQDVYIRRDVKADYSELRPKALIGPTASTIDFVKEMEENIDILKSKKS